MHPQPQFAPANHMAPGPRPFAPFPQMGPMHPMNYNSVPGMPMQPVDFAAGHYNQPNSGLMGPHQAMAPLPVPPPEPTPLISVQTGYMHNIEIQRSPLPQHAVEEPKHVVSHPGPDLDSHRLLKIVKRDSSPREERMKTPEPPVISDNHVIHFTFEYFVLSESKKSTEKLRRSQSVFLINSYLKVSCLWKNSLSYEDRKRENKYIDQTADFQLT